MPVKHVNPHYQKGIQTSKKEIIDLLKAWVLLGIAFAIVMTGAKSLTAFMVGLIISLVTIGVGFVFHELAHKFVAQRFGCFAEFRSFDMMLILAVIMSFAGFILAAPGAVMIRGHLTKRQNGMISAAGPAMNLVVALIFLSLATTGTGIISVIGTYGFMINSFLALFNMIPFAMFDGRKIWEWSKPVYIAMAAVALLLTVGKGLFIGG